MRPTPTKAEARLSKTQENKRDNKQPTGKQHADNQPKEDKSLRGGEDEKEEEAGREKRVNFSLLLNIIIIIILFYLK